MIIEYSVHPMDSQHSSTDIAEIMDILAASGLSYDLGAMSTCLEGSWEELMPVLQKCHAHLMSKHTRVISYIKIDDKKEQNYSLKDRIKVVQHKIHHDPEAAAF